MPPRWREWHWLAACVLILIAVSRNAPGSDQPQPGRTWTTAAQVPADGGVIARRLPRTVYLGGPFLRNPEATTVTFGGEEPELVGRLEAFGDIITQTSWWREVVNDYCLSPDDCIGDGRAGYHVRLDRKLPAQVRDVDIELVLEDESRAGSLSRLGREALVLVYLPAKVVLRDAFHPHYCRGGPRAYHRMLRLERASFAYAVVPRCGDEAELTSAASHEILEATTNPDPQNRGFAIEPVVDNAGFTAAGLEPVDPCGLVTMDRHRTIESGFVVQRAWSNRAARAGHNPCVPSRPESPYLAFVPRKPTVRLAYEGATARIELEAASDRAVGWWAVSAIDQTGKQEGRRYVDVKLDRARVAAGDVAVLTLRAVKLHPRRMSIVGVVSTLGPHSHMWPILVSMR
jgi:hypothetical protein